VWIIASLISPLGYLAVSVFGGGKEAATVPFDIFWPGSQCLIALEDQSPMAPMATIVCVWLTSIGTNVLLYTLIVLLLWPIPGWVLRDRDRGKEPEGKGT
jgi:hypothetical protein